jgi:hypothetical protein
MKLKRRAAVQRAGVDYLWTSCGSPRDLFGDPRLRRY